MYVVFVLNSTKCVYYIYQSKICMYVVFVLNILDWYIQYTHFNLQRENNLSIKDKMAGPKCVHYTEVPLQ